MYNQRESVGCLARMEKQNIPRGVCISAVGLARTKERLERRSPSAPGTSCNYQFWEAAAARKK